MRTVVRATHVSEPVLAYALSLTSATRRHPDIELGWGRAAFQLTTHSCGGLTRNDFVMAARIDELNEG